MERVKEGDEYRVGVFFFLSIDFFLYIIKVVKLLVITRDNGMQGSFSLCSLSLGVYNLEIPKSL